MAQTLKKKNLYFSPVIGDLAQTVSTKRSIKPSLSLYPSHSPQALHRVRAGNIL
jgi:hypothetical protein